MFANRGEILIRKDSDLFECRDDLLEQLQTLWRQIHDLGGNPGRVPTWLSKTFHQALSNRVGDNAHDDWNSRSCLLRRADAICMCYEYVRIKPHEFRRETGQMLGASLRPAVVDQDIPSFVVPQITQPLSERLEIGFVVR